MKSDSPLETIRDYNDNLSIQSRDAKETACRAICLIQQVPLSPRERQLKRNREEKQYGRESTLTECGRCDLPGEGGNGDMPP